MWLYESVIYQIYPIGFCGASRENNGETSDKILKVKEWVSYFKSIEVDSVLFNPIFDSDSHGYDTRDFMSIDKRLGTNENFKEVCKELKENDIKIILDGVFNHVGRGFWAFQDVLTHRYNSRYKDWFIINFDGNSSYNDGLWYEGWEGHYELVKLNLQNEEVVSHLLDSVKMWIEEFNIDALRLDVAYCLDHNFMRRLRSFCTSLKPDFALIGEVLFGDYNIIVNDDMLHSCTNYECYKGLFSSMNDKNLFEISHSLNRQFGSEQWCIYRGKHLMTFVDNHDVERIASILNDKNTLPIVYALLFGMPGVPCIYYGSEWGQEGKKRDGDWGLRPCFEKPIPNELTQDIKKMIEYRKNSKALNYGDYINVAIFNNQLLFKRSFENKEVYVAVNITNEDFTIHHHELNGNFYAPLNNEEIALNGQLHLRPYQYTYLERR